LSVAGDLTSIQFKWVEASIADAAEIHVRSLVYWHGSRRLFIGDTPPICRFIELRRISHTHKIVYT